jgi:hypothetical protein
MGGLGNQMFQYAIGRAVSIKKNTQLFLDLSFIENTDYKHSYRKYALGQFKIKAAFADFDFELTSGSQNIFSQIKSSFQPKKRLLHVKETDFTFDSNIFSLPDNSYFDGYWQSYKYFESIYPVIFEDFTFLICLSDFEKNILERIKSVNSVSVHIRRGDYITNTETNLYHGVCALSYYDAGLRIIKEQVDNPVFFIFSDDQDWAKQNIKLKHEHYFIDNLTASSPHSDLFLMSLCKNAIIANSSFSWWGAWLIGNSDKTVIAPKNWFANSQINTFDLIPKQWLRI